VITHAGIDPRGASFNVNRIQHWDAIVRSSPEPALLGAEYYRRIAEIYRFLVPPGLRVLEIGCGSGDLLAALKPAHGVGVDFSPAMVARAAARHPGGRGKRGTQCTSASKRPPARFS
jgi:SAM-dependent methyltransferase